MSIFSRLFGKKQITDPTVLYSARADRDRASYFLAEDGKWYTASELYAAGSKRKYFSERSKVPSKSNIGKVIVMEHERDPESGDVLRQGHKIFSNRLMAHALGAIDGKRYTNSKEALEWAYEKGFRYFEADVVLTFDDQLVLSHGFDEKACKLTGMEYRPEFAEMTAEMFLSQSVSGYTTMDFYDLKEFMQRHTDTYFEIDMHRTDVKKKLKKIESIMEGQKELLDRLLIQAESRKLRKEMKEFTSFDNYQLILGAEWVEKIEEGIHFALNNGVETIAMRHALWTKEMVSVLHIAGLNTMAYTLESDVKKAKALLEMGIDTICTDNVLPEDVKEYYY